MRAIMLGFSGRPEVVREAERLRPLVAQYAEVVLSDFTGEADLSQVEADLAIVFGGDGSILRAAHQMGYRQRPVIAVNLGKLGFLADLTPEDLVNVMQTITPEQLQAQVIEHLMFECQVFRAGQPLCRQLGLNEVAVQNGPPYGMLNVHLYVDSELVTTYSCDGLIVATPVGSTGHSLSVGGPILRKDLLAFVIQPISPHTLTNRPIVDSAQRVYEMVLANAYPDTAVIVDGRILTKSQPADKIRVQRAEPRFKLYCPPKHSYYRTLREKLGWSGRLNFGPRL
jgi:NAD+ kinase